MTTLVAHLDRTAGSRRSALLAAVALVGVAVIHLIDGPEALLEAAWIGYLELALVAGSLTLAVMLVARPSRDIWIVTMFVTYLALGFYMASRTIGLPGMADDVGSWGQTLEILNVALEVAVIGIAVHAIRNSH